MQGTHKDDLQHSYSLNNALIEFPYINSHRRLECVIIFAIACFL